MRNTYLFLLALFAINGLYAQDYYYHEVTAKQEADLVYKNVRNDKNEIQSFLIFSPITEQTHEIYLDKNFATTKWINTKPDKTIDTYTRDGEFIIAEVIRDKKTLLVKKNIDSDPWYASMEYGLGQFFRGGEQSVEFWNILPTNLETYKMKAEILTSEMIEVEGVLTQTLKVQVTINGIPFLLFHFLYWFRESDGLFVRFEGAKGIWGTPLTIMKFIGTDISMGKLHK